MGTLYKPKGMCSHLKKPNDPTIEVMYCLDASSISTCQKPDLRSKLENRVAVFLGSSIQLQEVNAKAEAALLLLDKDHSVAPRAATRLNSLCL